MDCRRARAQAVAAHMSGNGKTQAPSEPEDTAPHYHGHRERLRQRFRDAGSEAVTDYELLELVLFRALPRRDLKPLAKQLLATFGSFAEALAAPRERLAEIKGLGEAGITDLKIVHAAANRLARGQVAGHVQPVRPAGRATGSRGGPGHRPGGGVGIAEPGHRPHRARAGRWCSGRYSER